MRLTRTLAGAAALLLAVALPAAPQAGDVLTIVAPAAPGGGWDQLARTMARAIEQAGLARRVQVQNLPGAAGTIGLARFVTAQRGDPDAMLVTGLVMVGGIVANRAPVTLDRTTPLARLVGEYEVLAVPVESPYRTLGQLLDTLRARPGAISWGGGSAGGSDQILVDLIAQHAGVDPRRTNYVAFSGGGEAVTALLGAQVTVGVSGYGEFESHLTSGRLRALAISSRERVPGLDIATLRESGVPVDLANWRGIVAPPGIRPARRTELIALLDSMQRSAGWRAELERRGWSDLWLAGDAFARFLSAEATRVQALDDVRRGDGPPPRGTGSIYGRLTLIGLVLAAAVAFVRRRPAAAEPRAAPSRLGLLTLGMLLHLVLLQPLGFVAAGAVLVFVGAAALGARLRWRLPVAALVASALVWVLFDVALGVSLPRGTLWPG
jgi:putative tricarboxylic transport membrane protein